jgi:hypothetical protein
MLPVTNFRILIFHPDSSAAARKMGRQSPIDIFHDFPLPNLLWYQRVLTTLAKEKAWQ